MTMNSGWWHMQPIQLLLLLAVADGCCYHWLLLLTAVEAKPGLRLYTAQLDKKHLIAWLMGKGFTRPLTNAYWKNTTRAYSSVVIMNKAFLAALSSSISPHVKYNPLIPLVLPPDSASITPWSCPGECWNCDPCWILMTLDWPCTNLADLANLADLGLTLKWPCLPWNDLAN